MRRPADCLLACLFLFLLACGPEPVPCERLDVRVEVPTGTPYLANLQQGDSQWFECVATDAALASDAIEVDDEEPGSASVQTCGAEGFRASLFEPGVINVHVIYVDRFWVSRSIEVAELTHEAMPDDEACPSDEPIVLTIDNRVPDTICVGDETGEGCSLVAPVCDAAGNWYPSECAFVDNGPPDTCASFPGELCR